MNRRRFVSLLGIAGAVAAIAPKVPAAKTWSDIPRLYVHHDGGAMRFIHEGKTVLTISKDGKTWAENAVVSMKN